MNPKERKKQIQFNKVRLYTWGGRIALNRYNKLIKLGFRWDVDRHVLYKHTQKYHKETSFDMLAGCGAVGWRKLYNYLSKHERI